MSTAVQPFRIDVPEADLEDLRERLARTRWPGQLPGPGWSRGVPVAYLRRLAEHWRTAYDWREQEAGLNRLPQFTTEIGGQRIHFLHVRSPEPGALPLVLTHSWPSSVVEFTRMIGPLTDPRAHGADPAGAFHVVAPSIPGFGFSEAPRGTGWTAARVAAIWAELMTRLGYERFGAQGNDAGAIISPELGRLHPDRVVGVHITGGVGFPTVDQMSELTDEERSRLAGMYQMIEGGSFVHLEIQSRRPQTLAYGLQDSPVGQLAWIVERFKEWTDPAAALPEDAVDRDQLLTNVTLYWLTGTAWSSMWMYYEGVAGWSPSQSLVPTGNVTFRDDPAVRRLAERENRIVHWSTFDRGGHFAAMEVPDLLVADIREFFAKVA
jgi:epoxide hydrolase